MGQTTLLPTEKAAVVGAIDPDAYTANTYTTGWIALKDFGRFAAIVMAGDLGSGATVDAKLTAATSSGGAGAADISGATITQLTQAGSDDNKQAVINLSTDTLAGSAYTHFRLSMTIGTATSDAGAIVFGFDPRYSDFTDATTVDSITSI